MIEQPMPVVPSLALDLAFRARMLAAWRDLVHANRMLAAETGSERFLVLADEAELHASASGYGGRTGLAEMLEEGEP